jgi:pimeloyl-ACP methyl ester carboxylesterase
MVVGMPAHHVFLSSGMFGFGRLGSFDYFAHLEAALKQRFAAAGAEVVMHPVTDLPTASIRRRAERLADQVTREATGDGPIHLLGHSTGGIDARLVASPSTTAIGTDQLAWLPRLRSVTMMNTPHHGTPLAAFFTTTSGQRVLEALSLLTWVGLSLGQHPLTAASLVLSVIRKGETKLPFSPQVLSRAIGSLAGLVDDARSPEVRPFLAAIKDDQGAMLQLCPESMDLFAASFSDREGVRYGSTVSMAPAPKARGWLKTIGHPWQTVSLSLFAALHRITAAIPARYPCTSPHPDPLAEAALVKAFKTPPRREDNDGVVPIRSQLHGHILWAGLGDHLDVLGHFRAKDHRDWFTSGSDFSEAEFARLVDAIAAHQLG